MQAVSENLYRRGKRGTYYLRRRIPTPLRDAYPPGKEEVSCSLRTSDYTLAKQRLHAQMSAIDAQFERQKIKLAQRWNAVDRTAQHVNHLSDELVKELAGNYVHCVLESDEAARRAGLDDSDFEALGSRIAEQRRELGNLLARGKSERIVPAMQSFFHLCQINAQLSPEDERRASYVFLQAVVKALDQQARRQAGEVVATNEVVAAPSMPKTWKEVFETWRDYVVDRPKATTIACSTAWRQLEAFASGEGVQWPAHVTPVLMAQLIDSMRSQNLSPKTINERLRKIRAVYTIAIGKQVLNRPGFRGGYLV